MSLVEIRNLSKSYGTLPALCALQLDVPARKLLAVLGPSGCGKTTLLRVIAGFERQDAGTVAIDGVTVTGPPEKRRVGIVPQEGALFPHLDVAANVGFGVPRAGRGTRVREMLDLVGLSGFERRRPHELSGGQQQRVALARALAPAPTVILLDEPFTALDAGLRVELGTQVVELLRATGTTAVLVTHDQTEALALADTVAVMRHGTIVQTGSPETVYSRPVDIETARFLGDAVVIPGVCNGTTVITAVGTLGGVGRHGDVTVVLRPEQLIRDDTSPVRATVRSLIFHGHEALITLDVQGLAVVARWPAGALPHPGDELGVRVTGDVVIFPREPTAAAGSPP